VADFRTSSLQVRSSEWERFAQEDARHYICTDIPKDDPDAFWRSGEKIVGQQFLPLATRYKIHPGTAVEIGCGIGRLTIPVARHFDKVIGFDISSGMVEQASANAAARGVTNASFCKVEAPQGLAQQVPGIAGNVDFLYSFLVFQHIDDSRVIEAYMKSISTLLAPGGIAYVQFDSRPEGLLYWLKSSVPDQLLPRDWRRGIRRVRRRPAAIEASFEANSLEVVETIGAGTEMHWYIVRRTA
jgi:SAM-dependent methyltransferase